MTIKEYQQAYHPTKSERTVYRMIKRGLLPNNHKIVSSGIIIYDKVEFCDCFLINLIDYCKDGNFTHESAAKFCVENDYNMHKFCKMIGI